MKIFPTNRAKIAFLFKGDYGSVGMINNKGENEWTFGEGKLANDFVSGNILRPGEVNIAICFIGMEGIHILDIEGRSKWHMQESNVWEIGLLEQGTNRAKKLIYCNWDGDLIIRSFKDDSQKIVRVEGVHINDFETIQICVGKDAKSVILIKEKQTLYLIDDEGVIVNKKSNKSFGARSYMVDSGTILRPDLFVLLLQYPSSNKNINISKWIADWGDKKSRKDKEEHFNFLYGNESKIKSRFMILDDKFTILYNEGFKKRYNFAKIFNINSDICSVLIGSEENILQYIISEKTGRSGYINVK